LFQEITNQYTVVIVSDNTNHRIQKMIEVQDIQAIIEVQDIQEMIEVQDIQAIIEVQEIVEEKNLPL
jgi:hypothetical protein